MMPWRLFTVSGKLEVEAKNAFARMRGACHTRNPEDEWNWKAE
jgi:hypothetical protein